MNKDDRERRFRGCERKRGYESIPQARKAAAYVWSQTGTNLKVYKCQFCGKFHLTHKLDYEDTHTDSSRGAFVSSPNFTGSQRLVAWDHNDPIVRERQRKRRTELTVMEREAQRPEKPVFTEVSKANCECTIDNEEYISGKNRYRHKIRKLNGTVRCIRCGKEVGDLDATGLCDDCRECGFVEKAKKAMRGVERIKKITKLKIPH